MRALLIVLLGSSLLAACGGGGGSAGTTPTAGYLSITASNQDAVGRASVTASTTLLGAGGGIGGTNAASPGGMSTLSLSGSSAGHASASLGSLAMLVGRTIAGSGAERRNPQALGTAAAPARRLAIPPDTSNCSVSGSITVSFADSDNSGTPTIGDTMTLAFNQCHETATDNINGSVAITLSQIGVTNGLVSFTGSLAMQMSLTDGTRAATLNGTLTMSFAEHSATETQVQLVASGAGLVAGVNGGGLADTITFEQSFALNETDTTSTTPGGTDSSSATLNGNFSASSLGGRLSIQTTVQLSTEAYPRSGEVVISGDASALRLHAIDATTVRVELDANHDGTYEASKDVPWTTLLPG